MFRWKATAAAAALCAFTATPSMAQSTGFAEFAARVNGGSATLVRGSGVTTIGSTAPGVYVLTFARKILNCYPFVTVAGDTGFAVTQIDPDTPAKITVQTYNKAAALAKRNFNILVRCQD